MKKQACVTFQGLVSASTTEIELNDEQREHLDDCLECEGVYLDACAGAWISRDIAKKSMVQEIETRVLTEGVNVLHVFGIPEAFLPAVIRCAQKRIATN